jgi:ectonucleoside triphosphate diphosphohydrolase 5/6
MPAGMRKNSKNQSKNGSPNMFMTFVGLVVAVTVLLMVFLTYTDSVHPIVDGIAGHLGYREKQYAVILDAGSTGSRVLAYEFHRGYLGKKKSCLSSLFYIMLTLAFQTDA